MDPRLILAGQTVNPVNALAMGNQAGQQQNDMRYQQDYRAAVQQYGAGAVGGDQASMNALAAFDPQVAQNLASNQLGMDQTRLGMDQTRQNMGMQQRAESRLTEQMAMQVRESLATQSAADIEASRANLESILNGGAQFAAQGDQAGYERFLTERGVDPAQYPFNDFPAIAATMGGVLDLYNEALDRNAGPGMPSGAETLAYRAQEAGLQPGTEEYRSFMANGGVPREAGMRLITRPDGSITFTQGDVPEEGRMQPSSPASMLATIDGILADPALDTATGLQAFRQRIPGTSQFRFGTRANQLEGQAFLQAFESLKGAGQITEIEGAKATQAIGRLDTGQSATDYRDALNELRGILEDAQSRPEGWADSQNAPASAGNIPPVPPAMLQNGSITAAEWPGVWENMTPEQRALFE